MPRVLQWLTRRAKRAGICNSQVVRKGRQVHRNPITRGRKTILTLPVISLGIGKLHVKLGRDHQPHERALYKRPAYRIDPESGQTSGKFGRQRLHQPRTKTKRFQMEP